MNVCVCVLFEPMICLVWDGGQTHTDKCALLVSCESVRRRKRVPLRECQGDLLYNLNQVKSPE